MKTPFWSPFIAEGTVKTICWTLIHSLWIGLIIALLCGIVIAATRKSAAALRYRLLCGLLVLFVCAIGVTYYLEAGSTSGIPASEHVPNVMVKAPVNFVVNPITVASNKTFIDNVQAFFNQNANVIVLVWLLFFVLKSLKMASGLLYIQRIRKHKTHHVTEELKHRIDYLSSQIGIRRAVRLVQSELVKVPVAVGWLSPMILLPLGIVFQLTPEQLDGILWHELAHIRRRDYLVNILQGVVETVFFFNPGLLWLSSLIRTEREACCDDVVLSRMNHKANYLEALLSFGYGEFKQANYAMSIGSGSQLRDRLKRMISRENRRLGVVEKVILITGVVLLSAFAGLTKANKKYTRHLNNAANEKISAKTIEPAKQGQASPSLKDAPHGKIDSLINLTSTSYKKGDYPPTVVVDINAEDIHGKKYHLTLADNKLVGLEINSVKIKDSDLPAYQYMADMFRNKGKADGVVLAKRPNARDTDPFALAKAADTATHFRNLHYQPGSADKVNFTAFAEDADHNQYKISVINSKLIALTINGEAIQNSDLPKYAYLLKHIPPPPPPPPAKPAKPASPPGASGDKADTQLNKSQPQEPRLPPAPPKPPSLDKMISDVTNDLINEHIIKDKSALSTFKLTYSELLVNGVKQPDEIQKKFAAKYYPRDSRTSHGPNYGLWYNAKTHGVALGDFNIDLDAL